MSKQVILFNSYENEIFSAMWPAPFMYKGTVYKSIEAYYQFRKLDKTETELRGKILAAFDPYKAKHFGSKKAGGKPSSKHDVERFDIMRIGIRESYMQNPWRLIALMNTGKAKLSHLAEWDDFWGVNAAGKGGDQYGILTTEFRDSMIGVDIWKACKAHKLTEKKKKKK
jgi:ribA/ribD-fused uncharacterized protein